MTYKNLSDRPHPTWCLLLMLEMMILMVPLMIIHDFGKSLKYMLFFSSRIIKVAMYLCICLFLITIVERSLLFRQPDQISVILWLYLRHLMRICGYCDLFCVFLLILSPHVTHYNFPKVNIVSDTH